MSERRKFSRVVYSAPTRLIQANEQWPTELLDLSLQGALLRIPEGWNATDNADYTLSFYLDNSDIEISMQVELRHIDVNRLGFLCHHIDIDSLTHLRRLIELNVGDDKLLHRELEHLIEDEATS